jgi:hypothetical protein
LVVEEAVGTTSLTVPLVVLAAAQVFSQEEQALRTRAATAVMVQRKTEAVVVVAL